MWDCLVENFKNKIKKKKNTIHYIIFIIILKKEFFISTAACWGIGPGILERA